MTTPETPSDSVAPHRREHNQPEQRDETAATGRARRGRDERSRTATEVWMLEGDRIQAMPDVLTTEEALEIRLKAREGEPRAVAVTMRTPSIDPHSDAELAVGFLHGEGVVREAGEIRGFEHLASPVPGSPTSRKHNVVVVELETRELPDLATLDRHFYTSSACGVCGKGSLDALLLGKSPRLPAGPRFSPAQLFPLPDRLRTAQGVFRATGGIHAAGLFDAKGEMVAVREDVGRHNAVDKLVGWALMEGRLPLHGHGVLVSGRTSYEILQKCLMAEVPVVCAVSAPSSLAVSVARRFGITLVGFLRGERFNVYSGVERIVTASP